MGLSRLLQTTVVPTGTVIVGGRPSEPLSESAGKVLFCIYTKTEPGARVGVDAVDGSNALNRSNAETVPIRITAVVVKVNLLFSLIAMIPLNTVWLLSHIISFLCF